MEIGFPGFTQKRTARELIFGYIEQYIQDNFGNGNPAFGADPSVIDKIIALND